MKFFILVLGLVGGTTFPFISSSQRVVLPNEQPAAASIIINKLSWAYATPGKAATASVSVTNNSRKTIKSVRIFVIAKDEKGIVLQNFGSTLRPLISKDTIKSGQKKQLYFKNAFDNSKIAEAELKQATIEFDNGSLEILKN